MSTPDPARDRVYRVFRDVEKARHDDEVLIRNLAYAVCDGQPPDAESARQRLRLKLAEIHDAPAQYLDADECITAIIAAVRGAS